MGETLTAIQEPKNDRDRHAVCVKKDDDEIVGHVPRELL